MQIKNSNNKILILGDIFLDIFQTTNVIKISPERPVPVLQPKKSINLLKLNRLWKKIYQL